MNTNEIKNVLKENGFWAKKKMGQHFLVSSEVLDKIIQSAEVFKQNMILEVGPGLGVLTQELAKGAKLVLAIEKDRKLAEYLRRKFKSQKNIKIVVDNILFFDEKNISGDYNVVANLPYNITSPFLRKFLSSNHKPKEMLLMMQKEVAERITAKPGNRERGFLTVMVEFYVQNTQIVEIVDRDCFWPIPKVDSAIVRLKIRSGELKVDGELFLKFVKTGFSQKRRQIHHPLASGLHLSKDEVFRVLKKVELSPTMRAEELSLEEWIKLYKEISRPD